jgi:hypothetical protein
MQRSGGAAVLGVLALVGLLQGSAGVALAKDFDIDGTLECGVPSGSVCKLIDDKTGGVDHFTVGIVTSSISGTPQRVVVDVSWVLDKLRGFKQDGHVQYSVRDGIGPYLQVFSVVQRRGEGTDNPGLSTASDTVPESGNQEQEKERD